LIQVLKFECVSPLTTPQFIASNVQHRFCCLVGSLKRAAQLLVWMFSGALKRAAVWPM